MKLENQNHANPWPHKASQSLCKSLHNLQNTAFPHQLAFGSSLGVCACIRKNTYNKHKDSKMNSQSLMGRCALAFKEAYSPNTDSLSLSRLHENGLNRHRQ